MFSYTSCQKIFLYNLSPTLDNMVPCRNTNCTFHDAGLCSVSVSVALQTTDVYEVCSSETLNPNISKIKIPKARVPCIHGSVG
jgi:hypothetical protein